MARSTSDISIPREIPSFLSTSGFTYTGTAPQSTSALITLLWTFRGRIILSPALHTERTMLCTDDVVPPTIKNAWSAPNASAASSSASLITETGWHRLSNGFIEFRLTHFSPSNSASSGLPRPLLCPGTSKGTTLLFFNCSSASYTGALIWAFSAISTASCQLTISYKECA